MKYEEYAINDGTRQHKQNDIVRIAQELLSNLEFERFHKVATLLFLVSSIPSLNLTPVMTLAK